MGFFSAPNLIPWLLFKVSILEIRAWIVTEEFFRIRLHFNLIGRGQKKEKMVRGVGGGGAGDYSREAINRWAAFIRENTLCAL